MDIFSFLFSFSLSLQGGLILTQILSQRAVKTKQPTIQMFYPILWQGHSNRRVLFSAAVVVLTKYIPVHSFIVYSIYPFFSFTVPCRFIFPKQGDLRDVATPPNFPFLDNGRAFVMFSHNYVDLSSKIPAPQSNVMRKQWAFGVKMTLYRRRYDVIT